MEIIGPITDLVNNAWNCCGEHTSYLCHLEENLDALKVAMEELKNVRDQVKHRVERAEAQQMVRTPVVGGWLQTVETTELEVEEMLQQGLRQQMEKCWYCLKNCRSSYKLGKKVVKKLDDVKKLKDTGDNFDEVSDRSNSVVVQGIPESPTVGMEPLLKMAMELLEKDEVSSLGIYGMGDVGKTTLLKKINNQFLYKETNKDIDLVIWVEVSKDSSLGRLQYEITKRLGLTTQDEIDHHQLHQQRTHAIFNILSRRRFVLLLDDCWERVDLKQIGIPHPNTNQAGISCKSKVVFTTRSEDVCGHMEAKKKMKIECLDESNAWKLFAQKVGEEVLDIDPQVRELAEVVVEKCSGLPLALIIVGRTMASKKTPEQWNHAKTLLEKYASEFSGMKDRLFPLLKFSYDNLSNDTLRSCFLYCSLYPKNFNIGKEELIVHWLGEGLLDGFESIDEAHGKGHDIIGSLKADCLLESTGPNGNDMQVKMHDVVREMAIWIGCECGRKKDKLLVQPAANLSKAPRLEKWKEAERVSLMHNSIHSLGEDMSILCSSLMTLLLNFNRSLHVINGNFFQFLPNLQVLNLSHTGITHLPTSISNLVKLQLLDLSSSAIEELPTELKNLVKLKFLDLNSTQSLSRIPRGVISGLSNLQTLNLYGSGHSNWKNQILGYASMILVEVESLECLSAFGFTVHSSPPTIIQSNFLNNNKFQACTRSLEIKYDVALASVNIFLTSFAVTTSASPSALNLWGMKNLQTLNLSDSPLLEQLTIIWVEVERESLSFSRLETLILLDLPKLMLKWEKGLLSHAHQCFQKLHHVHICGCHALKDLSWIPYAPNLKDLHIFRCNGLESIVNKVVVIKEDQSNDEKTMMNPFSRLRILELGSLPKLESICENALPFPFLELISVCGCPLLTKLPFDSDSVHNKLRKIEGPTEWWDKLKWKDENVKASLLKYFRENY